MENYQECEACGNLLVKKPKKYCGDCYFAIKDKENRDPMKRIEKLERELKRLRNK